MTTMIDLTWKVLPLNEECSVTALSRLAVRAQLPQLPSCSSLQGWPQTDTLTVGESQTQFCYQAENAPRGYYLLWMEKRSCHICPTGQSGPSVGACGGNVALGICSHDMKSSRNSSRQFKGIRGACPQAAPVQSCSSLTLPTRTSIPQLVVRTCKLSQHAIAKLHLG